MQHARPNSATAQIVDEGIAMAGHSDRYRAAQYMTRYGVSFRVIVRVLAPGEAQRNSARGDGFQNNDR